jgi:hypothetical protein
MRWLLLLCATGCAVGSAAIVLLACSGSNGNSPAGVLADGSSTSLDDGASREQGDAAPADDRILPLAVGRTWTYALTPLDGGAIDCPGPPSAEVVGPGDVHDGGASLRYRSLCLDPGVDVDIVGTGDQLYAYLAHADGGAAFNNGAPYLFLDTPVADGHQWNYTGSINYQWHDAGTVKVQAGTFTDCWSRDQLGTDGGIADVFCRGVGQVSHRNTAGNYSAELTAKSF